MGLITMHLKIYIMRGKSLPLNRSPWFGKLQMKPQTDLDDAWEINEFLNIF